MGKKWLASLKKFLRKENPWIRPVWIESNEVIEMLVKPYGATSVGWQSILSSYGFALSDRFRDYVKIHSFNRGSQETRKVFLLRGAAVCGKLCATNVREKASGLGMVLPSLEVVCLILEQLAHLDLKEEMNLSQVVIFSEDQAPRYGGDSSRVLCIIACFRDGRPLSINMFYTGSADPKSYGSGFLFMSE